MKLKTLKDLVRGVEEIHTWISPDELKAEAIKWVKAIEEDIVQAWTVLWIQEFFNITEEDILE